MKPNKNPINTDKTPTAQSCVCVTECCAGVCAVRFQTGDKRVRREPCWRAGSGSVDGEVPMLDLWWEGHAQGKGTPWVTGLGVGRAVRARAGDGTG